MNRNDAEPINLGEITLPSGTLVVTDMGYLASWSGQAPPSHVPDQITDPVLRANIAAAQDFRLVGPDAEAAARAVDLQSLTYVYDIPRHGVSTIVARFQEAIDKNRFDARFESEVQRVPHRERARRAAAAGGADFLIDGVWTVAVGDLPTAKPMKVMGRRLDYGEGVGPRWSDITLEIAESQGSGESTLIGQVGVDWARIILIDADALGSWIHDDSLDGLADVAYWGRDVAQARAAFGGNDLEDRTVGWESLPEADAQDLAVRIERWRQGPDRRLMVDYRPHSHHYQLMHQIRRGDEFGVGTIDVGGARAVAFHTSWGDGIFPVFRDGSAGNARAIRIQLGDEDRRRRTQKLG